MSEYFATCQACGLSPIGHADLADEDSCPECGSDDLTFEAGDEVDASHPGAGAGWGD